MDGDRVVWLGNTMIEREQRYGYWETVLTSQHPDKGISFRNLGWSGDTVFGEARAGFGSAADGFRHLKTHVLELQPTVIIVAYGLNESFAGETGLGRFLAGLNTLLDNLALAKARIVFLAPPDLEDLGRPLPDPAANNKNLKLYREGMRKLAAQRGCLFLDLAKRLERARAANPPQPFTDNGIHFTPWGYWKTAGILFPDPLAPPPGPRGDAIRFKGPGPSQVKEQRLPLPPAPGESTTAVTAEGLRPGRYCLEVDGKPVATAAADAWAAGVKVPLRPEMEQVERLRAAIVEKNRLYFYRWRPQNETYLFGFRRHEQGQNAQEIPRFDPLVAASEKEIAKLRVPTAHRYELVRLPEGGQ